MSRIVVHANVVYLAGITADKTQGKSVGDQAAEILEKIEEQLRLAGSDKSKALLATIWLHDIRTVDEFNKVWDSWVAPGNTPARACVEARMQSPQKLIEIQLTAAR